MLSLAPIPTIEVWSRFAQAALLTTLCCLPLAWLLLRVTGVPPTYPPFLPQQIIAGTVGGALIATLGYSLLALVLRDSRILTATFLVAGLILFIASFYLPYRLSYTTSPRFAGATLSALVGHCVLHALVVGLSMVCLLRR